MKKNMPIAPAPRVIAIVASRVLYGQERANLLVLESLRDQGCEVMAIAEDHSSFPTIPQELKRRNIEYEVSPMVGRRVDGYLWDFAVGNPWRFIKANWRMGRWIREFGPTHIHIPNPFYFLTFMLRLKPNISVIYRIGDKPSTHNAFWRWLWRRIVRRVDHFVAISEFIERELITLGVGRERITVIYNTPPTRAGAPQPESLPDHPQHLLYIGQISAVKGVDHLVDAFRQIAVEFPKAKLTIAGRISSWQGDDWARNLRDLTISDASLANRVQFVGEIEDIYSLLANAAVIVVPSVFEEPLSNVVGEGKIAARAAVISPRGGLPELIEHGQDGYICDDTSVEALATGLRYYLSDPEKVRRHGRAALASLERLGVNEFAGRWRKVYDQTMLVSGA